jgi:hypothetical protein
MLKCDCIISVFNFGINTLKFVFTFVFVYVFTVDLQLKYMYVLFSIDLYLFLNYISYLLFVIYTLLPQARNII